MKTHLLFGAAIVFLFAAQAAFGQQADLKAGKASYDKSCATCHSADGAPKEAIAKMMKVEIPHLGSAEVQAKSDADLHKAVMEGVGKMKPVKSLDHKDVANVIAYVRTFAKK